VKDEPVILTSASCEKLSPMQEWPRARLVAIVADTHGLVRESVLSAVGNVDLILHAGDVGHARVLDRLRECAPVVAIRGNVDSEMFALPPTELVSVHRRLVYLLHSLADLDLNPAVAGFSMVVSGHSHKPLVRSKDGVLYVNPGSIGPRRFKLPISFALADFGSQPIDVRLEEVVE
jgi:putative phosphoesterase